MITNLPHHPNLAAAHKNALLDTIISQRQNTGSGMNYEVLYVIKPKSAFIELLNAYPNYKYLFVRPVAWFHERGGYNSPNQQEYITGVKLFFLARFRSDLLRDQADADNAFLKQLMGEPPFSVALFDQWWDLEEIDLVSHFEDAVGGIKLEQLQLFGKTDIPKVDDWISGIGDLIRKGLI